jgi:hypothetical protein
MSRTWEDDRTGWLDASWGRLLFTGDVISHENTWPPEIKILAMTFNPQ